MGQGGEERIEKQKAERKRRSYGDGKTIWRDGLFQDGSGFFGGGDPYIASCFLWRRGGFYPDKSVCEGGGTVLFYGDGIFSAAAVSVSAFYGSASAETVVQETFYPVRRGNTALSARQYICGADRGGGGRRIAADDTDRGDVLSSVVSASDDARRGSCSAFGAKASVFCHDTGVVFAVSGRAFRGQLLRRGRADSGFEIGV